MGKYYHGAENWTGQPAVIQIDPFIAPNDVLHAPFSIQWEGKLYVPASGLYTFGTKSDDGSFLYIDGKLVVDNGGQHGDRYVEGRIELEKGFHDIVILYFQAGGGRKMEFWWTPPGGAKEIVPVDYLIPPGVPAKEPVKMVTPPPAPTALGEVRYLTGWGGQGEEEGLFQGPRGVAAAKGKVYVADTRNRRIQVFDAKGRFIASFGREAGLEEPFDLVVDEQGNIYVLDPLKDCVVKLSPEGRLLGKLGTKFGLYRPRGIDIHNGSLYIADTGGNRVMVISTDGELRAIIGEAGSGPGQFNQPTDVAVDDAGNIYVADTYNLRLQKLDSLGRYILEWPIPRANTFDGPHIAIWKGIIYVTDPEGHMVAAYNVEGELIGEWGGAGEGPGQFNKPVGLAVDAEGRVYIADAYNHRVQKFEVVK
jgi:sugar lactone lactonase YvrE